MKNTAFVATIIVLIGAGCSQQSQSIVNTELDTTTDTNSVATQITSKQDLETQTLNPVFPTQLIDRESSINSTWSKPIALRVHEGCISNPSGELASEFANPACVVWSEAIISSSNNIIAQVVPVDVNGKQGVLQILQDDENIPLPPLPIDSSVHVAAAYINEQTILVDMSGYEWQKQVIRQGDTWQEIDVPESIQKAFPWDPTPPFTLLEISERYDHYVETRWPSRAEGYFGEDANRSIWALTYIVDRITGKIVEEGVLKRP